MTEIRGGWQLRLKACLLALLVWCANHEVVAGDSYTTKRASQLIEKQAINIVRAAHPLGKYESLKLDGYRMTDGNQELTYTFRWTGAQEKQAMLFFTTLAFVFTFDDKNEISNVVVNVLKDSSRHAPFTGGKVAVSVLKGYLKGKLKYLGEYEIYKQVDDMEAKKLLGQWLKYAEREKKRT